MVPRWFYFSYSPDMIEILFEDSQNDALSTTLDIQIVKSRKMVSCFLMFLHSDIQMDICVTVFVILNLSKLFRFFLILKVIFAKCRLTPGVEVTEAFSGGSLVLPWSRCLSFF